VDKKKVEKDIRVTNKVNRVKRMTRASHRTILPDIELSILRGGGNWEVSVLKWYSMPPTSGT